MITDIRRYWCSLLVFLALVFCGADSVAANGSLQVDSSGTCPAADGGSDYARLLSRAASTFIYTPEAELFRDAKARRLRGVSARLGRAFEEARVMAFHERPDGVKYFFAQFPETEVCGWISEADIFGPDCLFRQDGRFSTRSTRLGPRALKMSEAKAYLGASCEVHEGHSGLSAKVVLQNLNETVVEAENDGIRLYLSPGEAMPADLGNQWLRAASSFQVFDARLIDTVGDDGERKTGEFLLIGRRSASSVRQVADRFLVQGWVNTKDIYTWSTRYSAFWSKPVYTGDLTVHGYKLRTDLAESPGKFVATSPSGYVPEPSQVVPAMPLLEENISPFDQGMTTIQIGIQGNGADEGLDIAEERRKLVQNLESLARIDVLFLLDNSKSMEKYFGTIAELVPFLAGELDERVRAAGVATPSLRVAVSTYGDYKDHIASVETVDYRRIFSFADVTERNAARRLRDALAAEVARSPVDAESDLREASFAGIIQAAKSARWRDDAGLRIIIHLADHGNRDAGRTSEEYRNGELKSDLTERISQADVETALCTSGVYYAPIAVQGSTYDEVANGALVGQARQLSDSVTCNRFLTPKVTYSGASRENDKSMRANVAASVYETFSETISLMKERADRIECIRSRPNPETCISPREPEETNSWRARIRAGVTEDFGFDDAQLLNLYGQSQPSLALHYPIQSNGEEAFNYYIAATQLELATMGGVYSELCDLAKNTSISPLNAKDLLIETVELASGDNFEESDEGFKTFIRRLNEFPAKHLHGADSFVGLEWEVDEGEAERRGIVNILQSDEAIGFAKSVCRTSFLLQNLSAGRKVDLDKLSYVSGEYETLGHWTIPDDATEEYRWDVPSLSGVQLYFVPLEYFVVPAE